MNFETILEEKLINIILSMQRNSDIWQIFEEYFKGIFTMRILEKEKVQMKYSSIWKIQFKEKISKGGKEKIK